MDSFASSYTLHHKRSKSASDGNSSTSKNGTSYRMGNNCVESKERKLRCNGSQDSSDQFSVETNDGSVDHRASLENDIKTLQMHLSQEKSMRMMLERAIGRASSNLSPGHRHFSSQTKELIAEIGVLEEEIANREQHVLTLYRSIFDQCVSAPASGQSSGLVSPAHTKAEARKHPSIITSTFCSSKKFPLKTFNIMSSLKESRKNASLKKHVMKIEFLTHGNTKSHTENNRSSTLKKLPSNGKGYLTRTLREHLHQCPSKLSEELVRCMASIYFLVGNNSSSRQDRSHSLFLSRSCTSVIKSQNSDKASEEWNSQSLIEITSISMDKNHFSSASCAISNYRLLVEQLERVDATALGSNVKLAFWINVYNCLVMHAYLFYGLPHNSLKRIALSHKAAYNIGGHTISASFIESSVLCLRTPRVGRWYETIISTAMRKKCVEEKQLLNSKIALDACQPLALFALCNGAASDPILTVYTAKNVISELEKAKSEFLQSNIVVKKSSKIYMPKILDRYAKETCLSYENLLKWASMNVDKNMHEGIQNCRKKKKASQLIEWLPYNTSFRYMFETNLIETPWRS